MDILKRSLAPVTDEAWDQIEQEATRSLKANLSARRIVDVVGPLGFEASSVNVGRLTVPEAQAGDIRFGVRRVLPLVEARAQLELGVWELDDAARGARDLSLDAVTQAAERIARFEEEAVYRGFGPAGIVGLAEAAANQPVPLGGDASGYPDAVARALIVLHDAGVPGPYALALGRDAFRKLEGDISAYPPRKVIEELIDGAVVYAPFIDGGFLVSTRGGDLELTVGLDFSIGYETHDTEKVRLFVTESFTFQALNRNVIVRLEAGS